MKVVPVALLTQCFLFRLNQCNVSEESCSALATALTLQSCSVRELELSNNSLQDSGVTQLSAGLKHRHCKLQVLRLNTCDLMEGSGSALAEVFKSKRSQLRELELSNNSLQDSGVTQLSAGLNHHHCKLQVLRFNKCDLTGGSCSALAEVLSSEVSQLRELELSNNSLQDSGVTQLSAGLKNPQSQLTIMRLCHCSVSAEGCAALAKALEENRSRLTELHLSGNNAGDSGIKHISNLLQNPHCVLEKLIVNDNNIREEGYTALAEALRSNPSSHLIELDLRGNDPGASGVKLLTDLLQDPHCTLETLRLVKSGAAQEGYDLLYRVLGKNPLLQRELTVNEKIHGDSQVKQISALLEDSHCRPERLTLNNSRMRSEGCAALASALSLNPSQLRELDLRGNTLGGSGMKLGGLLRNQRFKLQKLWLCKCSLTEEDCADVVAALRTNPSHLQELDLSDNTVGSRGVKELSDLLQNSNCTLEKLKLYNCSLTEQLCDDLAESLNTNSSSLLRELDLRGNYTESKWHISISLRHLLGLSNRKLIVRIVNNPEAEQACDHLTEVLGTNPLLQKELDLSGKISGDSGVKQLSALLKDPLCRSEKLRLRNSSVTERSCTDVISALTTNPSHLTELDLSENTLGNAGVIQISTLLKTPSCKLHTLLLSDCSITEKGYVALVKALRSSHLKELDLRGNDPGASGVKLLRSTMNNTKCNLRLLKSPDAQKSYLHLREVLGINPILQTDLDLSGKIEGDSGVEHLSALLKDPHCRPEKLQLSECNMTVKGCSALLEALRSESSTLRELNLSKNRIQDSGVKLLSAELKRKHCKLETVRLSDCSITEEGYTALAEALRSNPSSHLKELDLRGNDPGASGVKKLIEIQKNHKLETLRLLKSADAAEVLGSLSKIVGEDPLLHRELDLSRKTPGDVNVKNLSALLQDPHYRLQKLTLYKEGSIKEDDCVGLFSALDLNPSHLKELNLNRNKPGESGLRNLCDLLKNPECKLQKLQTCKILSDESCADVASALCTNPSHIRDLDLSGCELGDAGVKKLCDLLKKDECKLEKLRLKQCRISDGSCSALTEALKLHSHLKKLDLRNTKVNAAVKKQLSEILERSGGSLITDQLSLMKSKLTRAGKKQDMATSDPKSSTAQGEERDGEMQNTEPGGSDVDSNADSSEDDDDDDDDSQQDQDSKGTDTDVNITDNQTVETSV